MANLYPAVYFYCIVRDFYMMPNFAVFADSSAAMKIRTTKCQHSALHALGSAKHS